MLKSVLSKLCAGPSKLTQKSYPLIALGFAQKVWVRGDLEEAYNFINVEDHV